MMQDIEDLLTHVLPYAPGCAEPTAVQHLREAVIRFCERTRCWRFIDTFLTTGEHHEILAVPSDAVLFEIEWAKFNNRELEAVSPQAATWHNQEGYTEPRYITQVNPNCVSLEPHAVGELVISMFLKPAPTALEIPAFMICDFGRALADGALATLLLLPNQPFTNPQMAAVFEGKFQASMDRNFANNMRGQQRAAKRTKPNYF